MHESRIMAPPPHNVITQLLYFSLFGGGGGGGGREMLDDYWAVGQKLEISRHKIAQFLPFFSPNVLQEAFFFEKWGQWWDLSVNCRWELVCVESAVYDSHPTSGIQS